MRGNHILQRATSVLEYRKLAFLFEKRDEFCHHHSTSLTFQTLFAVLTAGYLVALGVHYKEKITSSAFVVVSATLTALPYWRNISKQKLGCIDNVLTGTVFYCCIFIIGILTGLTSTNALVCLTLIYRLSTDLTFFDNLSILFVHFSALRSYSVRPRLFLVSSFIFGVFLSYQLRRKLHALWDAATWVLIRQSAYEKNINITRRIVAGSGPMEEMAREKRDDIGGLHSVVALAPVLSTRSSVSTKLVVTSPAVEAAIASELIPSPDEYTQIMSSVSAKLNDGLRRYPLAVMAFKPIVFSEHECMLQKIREFEIFNVIDEVATLNQVVCVRRGGGLWVGCVGFTDSLGSSSFDCHRAVSVALSVCATATQRNIPLSCAIGYGTVTGGYIGSVKFDLFGEEVRWVLNHVELRRNEIMVSEVVHYMITKKREQETAGMFKFEISVIQSVLPDTETEKVFVVVPSESAAKLAEQQSMNCMVGAEPALCDESIPCRLEEQAQDSPHCSPLLSADVVPSQWLRELIQCIFSGSSPVDDSESGGEGGSMDSIVNKGGKLVDDWMKDPEQFTNQIDTLVKGWGQIVGKSVFPNLVSRLLLQIPKTTIENWSSMLDAKERRNKRPHPHQLHAHVPLASSAISARGHHTPQQASPNTTGTFIHHRNSKDEESRRQLVESSQEVVSSTRAVVTDYEYIADDEVYDPKKYGTTHSRTPELLLFDDPEEKEREEGINNDEALFGDGSPPKDDGAGPLFSHDADGERGSPDQMEFNENIRLLATVNENNTWASMNDMSPSILHSYSQGSHKSLGNLSRIDSMGSCLEDGISDEQLLTSCRQPTDVGPRPNVVTLSSFDSQDYVDQDAAVVILADSAAIVTTTQRSVDTAGAEDGSYYFLLSDILEEFDDMDRLLQDDDKGGDVGGVQSDLKINSGSADSVDQQQTSQQRQPKDQQEQQQTEQTQQQQQQDPAGPVSVPQASPSARRRSNNNSNNRTSKNGGRTRVVSDSANETSGLRRMNMKLGSALVSDQKYGQHHYRDPWRDDAHFRIQSWTFGVLYFILGFTSYCNMGQLKLGPYEYVEEAPQVFRVQLLVGLLYLLYLILPSFVLETRYLVPGKHIALLGLEIYLMYYLDGCEAEHQDDGFIQAQVLLGVFFVQFLHNNYLPLDITVATNGCLLIALLTLLLSRGARKGSYGPILYLLFSLLMLALRYCIEFANICYFAMFLELLPHLQDRVDMIKKSNRCLITGQVNGVVSGGFGAAIAPSLSLCAPKRLRQCAVVAIHVKPVDLVPDFLDERATVEFLGSLFRIVDECISEAGMLKVSSFGGMVLCVSSPDSPLCNSDRMGLRKPVNYATRAVILMNNVQRRMDTFLKERKLKVSLGVGVDHGRCVLGLLGGRQLTLDATGACRDLSQLLACHGSNGVFAAEAFQGMLGSGSVSSSRHEHGPLRLATRAVDVLFEHTIQRWLRLDGSFNGIELSDFEYICELGKGGYGSVHLVEEIATKYKYAIKKVPIRYESSKMIRREFLILQQMQHYNVVNFLYCMVHNKSIYLVMDFVNGGNLQQIVRNYGDLEIDTFRFWFAELVSALEYVHSLGIIHRDVKPTNCMIDEKGHLMLVDFGLSKFISPTKSSKPVGGDSSATTQILSKLIPLKANMNKEVDTESVTVLLVECSASNGLPSRCFQQLQCMGKLKVLTASSAAIALDILSSHSELVELVLIDIDGSEQCTPQESDEMVDNNILFLKQVCDRGIPAVALTNSDKLTVRQRCVQAGAKDTLPKELRLRELELFVRWGSLHRAKRPLTTEQSKLQSLAINIAAEEQAGLDELDGADLSGGSTFPSMRLHLQRTHSVTSHRSADTSPENNDRQRTAVLTSLQQQQQQNQQHFSDAGTEHPFQEDYVPLAEGANNPLEDYSAVGTLHYLAPEVVRSRQYGECIDWWAVGVTMYECLAKQHLFTGPDKQSILEAIAQRPANLDLLRRSKDHKDYQDHKDLHSLVTALLQREFKHRLGYKGASDIKSHKFFRKFRWNTLFGVVHPDFKPAQMPVLKQTDAARTHFFGSTVTNNNASAAAVAAAAAATASATPVGAVSTTIAESPSLTSAGIAAGGIAGATTTAAAVAGLASASALQGAPSSVSVTNGGANVGVGVGAAASLSSISASSVTKPYLNQALRRRHHGGHRLGDGDGIKLTIQRTHSRFDSGSDYELIS